MRNIMAKAIAKRVGKNLTETEEKIKPAVSKMKEVFSTNKRIWALAEFRPLMGTMLAKVSSELNLKQIHAYQDLLGELDMFESFETLNEKNEINEIPAPLLFPREGDVRNALNEGYEGMMVVVDHDTLTENGKNKVLELFKNGSVDGYSLPENTVMVIRGTELCGDRDVWYKELSTEIAICAR